MHEKFNFLLFATCTCFAFLDVDGPKAKSFQTESSKIGNRAKNALHNFEENPRNCFEAKHDYIVH